jgi:pyruvate kinase
MASPGRPNRSPSSLADSQGMSALSWVMGPGRTAAGVVGAAGVAGIIVIGLASNHADASKASAMADLVREASQEKTRANLWALDLEGVRA